MTKQYLLMLFAATVILVPAANAEAQDDGLALTPPMGWNSWGRLGCEGINEVTIKEIADAMVSSGMKDAGYEYVVIDDCWQVDRDEEGNIIPDPKLFPSGMKALADYIHSKGLKFGLYSCAGPKTCAKRPGSWGHEYQDAQQYADWGVDFLKYDWCTAEDKDSVELYSLMRDALKKTSRPIVFSICEWGDTKPWLWGKGIGHLWRIGGGWDKDWATEIVDRMNGLAAYAGPGHWNDPDFLQVGNFFDGNPRMDVNTKIECQAHFSLWCLLAAPLMASNDIRDMSADVAEILTNKEVIAVNQDSLGIQGRKVRDDGNLEVWSKQLKDAGRASVLFNRSNSDEEISVAWSDIGYADHLTAEVRDLWLKRDLGEFRGSFTATVPPRGVVMVTIKPVGGDDESTISDHSSAKIMQKIKPGNKNIVTNSIGMKFKLIHPGKFNMGSPGGEAVRIGDELDRVEITLTKPYYIGMHEVTQEQWEEVMDMNPSDFVGKNRPVENVSWNDVQKFLAKMSEEEGVKYRLPTEAEWEYACRAGMETTYYWGKSWEDDYGWCDKNSRGVTHDVGMKKPNAWGLHDMIGNVWEWCQDWYAQDFNMYPTTFKGTDPQGPSSGEYRVLRGGSWFNEPKRCRSAHRNYHTPDNRDNRYGFRVARTP